MPGGVIINLHAGQSERCIPQNYLLEAETSQLVLLEGRANARLDRELA